MHGINFTQCIKRVFVASSPPRSAHLHFAICTACSANPRCLVSQSPNNSIHASFICRPSRSPTRRLAEGKLSVFISAHQFEEIFSALIDSAVDMPDELSSEDYFFFFPLCVSDSSAEAQADTGIQMGANADRAIVLLQHAGTERSGIAGIGRREGGGGQ